MLFYKIRKTPYRYTKPPHSLGFIFYEIQLFLVFILSTIKHLEAAHDAVFHFHSIDFVPLGVTKIQPLEAIYANWSI